ncbi:FAD-dependent oxidoreductase [Granulosicoccus antarcticus]|uniref:tRNA 5-methylaminomethyl-2-thiouridine biosynthesis bifunctional protein MnmC n=1 Tax=Granulosicoccus antarcticus IMCC3135 TaxID=1192854 RepID=A0A2Z2P2W2_9GAMM|nr:FAD-dependent oxidoreductase [Granulosicoccus antarcticus]ASJ74927.1 tRNA 5-methylaminomethyl-2-thiouridine biosynthesis bifunctional protein MnmC [Granulosicoccus antarcticus IMCC3135]
MSPSKSTNYLIVGGGITGCVSALLLAEQGISVTLCESSSHLGGILRDHVSSGERFFTSCQYLSVNEPWFQLLPSTIRRELAEFEHSYGSVTDFEQHCMTTRSMAMPVFATEKVRLEEFSANLDNATLSSRLSFYPEFVEKNLRSWVRRYGVEPESVSGENAAALQISRVHLANHDAAVTVLKQQPDYDASLALPFKYRHPDQSIQAALPTEGFDAFFELLENYMISRGIQVMKNKPIKLRKNGMKIQFWSRSERMDYFDNLIWACNPNPLLRGLEFPALDNVHGKSETHFYDLDLSEGSVDTCYYQIFSDQTDINRLFTYSVAGKPKLTVECFAGNRDKDQISTEVHILLRKLGHEHTINWQSSTKEKRYIFYSESDKAILSQLAAAQTINNCRILDAGWLDFGRNAKINRIMDQIDQGNETHDALSGDIRMSAAS